MVRPRLSMPFLHEGANDAFGFPIGPRMLHFGEALAHAGLPAERHDRMIDPSFVFAPVVGIYARHGERQDASRFLHEHGGRVRRLVWEDIREEAAGVIVDCDEEVFSRLYGGFSAQERKTLGIQMQHLARYRFLVAIQTMCLARSLRSNSRFGLRELLEAIGDGTIPMIHRRTILEDLEASVGECAVYGFSRYFVFSSKHHDLGSHAPAVEDVPPLVRQQFGILVHVKRRERLMACTRNRTAPFGVSKNALTLRVSTTRC